MITIEDEDPTHPWQNMLCGDCRKNATANMIVAVKKMAVIKSQTYSQTSISWSDQLASPRLGCSFSEPRRRSSKGKIGRTEWLNETEVVPMKYQAARATSGKERESSALSGWQKTKQGQEIERTAAYGRPSRPENPR
jgi:hypothetical protein